MCSKITKVGYDIIWTALYSPIYSFMQTQLFVSEEIALLLVKKINFCARIFIGGKKSYMLCAELSRCPTVIPSVRCTWTKITSLSDFVAILSVWKSGPDLKKPGWPMEKIQEGVRVRPAAG